MTVLHPVGRGLGIKFAYDLLAGLCERSERVTLIMIDCWWFVAAVVERVEFGVHNFVHS